MRPSLAEIQRALAARIVSGNGPNLDAWIGVPAGVDRAARLAVYSGGYPARIREALRETFPAIAHILGDASFSALAFRYSKRVPAELRNLNLVGAALPAYLRSDRASDDLPFLPALAELEWAVECCFHAEVLSAFEPATCSGWSLEDWGRARIGFQPGLALVCAAWPLRELRETCRYERSEIDVDLVDRRDRVLVYRSGYAVAVESIGSHEAEALRSLQNREPLGEVTAKLAGLGAEPGSVVEFFGRWVSLGLVVTCETAPPS